MNSYYLITLTMLLIAGIACQLMAWRLKLPAILFLLLAGFIAGPVTGIFNPDDFFGNLLFPIVSLGVAIILFEGSLTLKFEDISSNASVIWRLVSLGALVTFGVAAAAAYYLAQAELDIALLFGAIVTVTGPTVIAPILRTVRPHTQVANLLRWEGIIIDPLGAILAVLVFEYITSHNTGNVWIVMAGLFFTGLTAGFIAAQIMAFILRFHLIPDFLVKMSVLAAVIGVYTLCDFIQPESGLLAVTVMGIVLANKKGLNLEEILDFKESLSILIISGLFIILSARMDISIFTTDRWDSLLVLLVILFVARPLSIFISTIGSKLPWNQRALMCWIAPRGIIAAAIAPLFTLKLEQKEIAGAEFLTPMVFVIIIGTVVMHSLTAGKFARWLGVAEPAPRGVLIVSANRLARAIGLALKETGFNVMLADTNWENISEARMKGLRTFFGNVVSEYADRHMDLMGIGKLLAISNRPTVNALACLRYKREFGSQNVFIIKTEEERHTREKDYIAHEYTAPYLFGGAVTQAQLTGMLASGYEIRATNITESFTYENFSEKYKNQALLLFAITKKKDLIPFIENKIINPEAGWIILSLLPVQDVEKPPGKT